MVRTMRNHEAAHTIVAMHFGIRFNTVSHDCVKFPQSASSTPGYKVAIAAGCLGEFYEIWFNCNKGNALTRRLGKPIMDCLTPIEKAVSVFCR